MTELDDHELLAEFSRSECEAAFATLAARHLPLVHSAALRFSGNPHHAQEIAQAVFIILARKAGSISRRTILSAWLYQTARLTAANFVKRESRRHQREQEAYMQSTVNESDAEAWQQIAPLLDDAMGDLGETDRNAVVLRFFENKSAAEVAVALRTTEAAAHKRLARALEKLRKIFVRRGVTLTATLIASAVSANSVQAVPAGLPATVVATAANGILTSATLTTLVNGTMKTMLWIKIKLAVVLGIAAVLAGGAATVVISQSTGNPQTNRTQLSPDEIFRKSAEAYAALSSYSDDGRTVATLNGTTITHAFSIKLGRPDLYRIEWDQRTESAGHKSTNATQLVWSDGKGDFQEMFGKVKAHADKNSALTTASGISGGATATVPGAFFRTNWPSRPGRSSAGQERQGDEKVGDVDCYVLAKTSKGRSITLWIGKQDFLIRQVRTVTSAEAMKKLLAEPAGSNPSATPLAPTDLQDITSTETHEHIVLNKKLLPADFAR